MVVTVYRPFLFAIWECAAGGPLFLGRVTDPRPLTRLARPG